MLDSESPPHQDSQQCCLILLDLTGNMGTMTLTAQLILGTASEGLNFSCEAINANFRVIVDSHGPRPRARLKLTKMHSSKTPVLL